MPGSNPSFDFQGAVVLVTGGAKGIGRAIAEAFLGARATVIVCGRVTPQGLPSAAGISARFIPCDVRDPQAVRSLFDAIGADYARLDVLVNNAGGSPPASAAQASPRFVEKIVQLNLLGALYCSQAANALMQRQAEGGCIVNIASVSGERPSPGTAAYGAAKAGLLHATESLAIEWGPKVRVNAVVAGLVHTPTLENEHAGGAVGIARIREVLPMRRLADAADIASTCLYLASPLAQYVSGARLAVHGGGEPPAFLYLASQAREHS